MNANKEFSFVEEEGGLSLKEFLFILRRYWHWFVIAVAACVFGAYIYLQWAPKMYVRTASVLIKDDSRGGALSESAAFEDLGMFNVKRNVDNEILIFKSKQMMLSVVRRLHLDISYTVKNRLRTEELYTKSPVILQFLDAEESLQFSLEVIPLSEKEVRVMNYSNDVLEFDESLSEGKKVQLNDTINSPFGRMIVTPSLYYGKEYYEKTVTVTKSNLANVALEYSNAIQVALANKAATIINISLQDVSIPRAEDVINTLIAVYNEDAISDKNKIMVNTSEFINERLVIIEKELGNVDADIESYKREHQLTDIQSAAGVYLKESSQFGQEEMSLLNELSLSRFILEYLNDPKNQAELIPSNTGVDVNLERQIGEYNNILLKRNRLTQNSSDRNPVVQDLNNSLIAMRQTIIRTVDNLIVGLDIKINNMRQREMQNQRRITAVPTQQRRVLSIERQQSIKESLYLYLLNKREENALSEAITESNARIIDPATGTSIPVSPKTNVILLASFILGLIIPSGAIWLRYTLDTKVHTRRDLEDVLTAPFLGGVPQLDKKEKKSVTNEIAVRVHGRDTISEAFRIIRTNMDFMQVKEKEMKVILFTSFNPGAGKTFVSSNLAVSIAMTQKNVVLVDLDLRKRTISKQYVESSTNGVSNYLSGKIDSVDEIIQGRAIGDMLDLIPAGPEPPNPAELLLSNRLESLIEELRARYDYIILDNVPAGLIADSAIVNRVADLTMFVLRAGLMEKPLLPELEKMYKLERFNNMSVILNGVDTKNSYHYGYGYGYGSNEEK